MLNFIEVNRIMIYLMVHTYCNSVSVTLFTAKNSWCIVAVTCQWPCRQWICLACDHFLQESPESLQLFLISAWVLADHKQFLVGRVVVTVWCDRLCNISLYSVACKYAANILVLYVQLPVPACTTRLPYSNQFGLNPLFTHI